MAISTTEVGLDRNVLFGEVGDSGVDWTMGERGTAFKNLMQKNCHAAAV